MKRHICKRRACGSRSCVRCASRQSQAAMGSLRGALDRDDRLPAYQLCFYDRLAAGAFEFLITVNFVLYYFFPLPAPLPEKFPGPWWISALIAALIGIPTAALILLGLRDAGEEAMRPKVEHTLYGGIYERMRHPQAVGEVFLFPVIAILLNSPFLTLFSLIYFPIFMMMCYAEEQDLLLRYGEAYAEYCQRTGAFWPKRS